MVVLRLKVYYKSQHCGPKVEVLLEGGANPRLSDKWLKLVKYFSSAFPLRKPW